MKITITITRITGIIKSNDNSNSNTIGSNNNENTITRITGIIKSNSKSNNNTIGSNNSKGFKLGHFLNVSPC